MKVLIIDNTIPAGPAAGWIVNADKKLECAAIGQEHFVIAQSLGEASKYHLTPSGWLAAWHRETDAPPGLRGRRFHHSTNDQVFASGLSTLLKAVKQPATPVGCALDELIFCLLDPEAVFLRATIRILAQLHRLSIDGKAFSRKALFTERYCNELTEGFAGLDNAEELTSKIRKRCAEQQDRLTDQNALTELTNFRDFLLGGDDGRDGIMQEIKSLASPARPA